MARKCAHSRILGRCDAAWAGCCGAGATLFRPINKPGTVAASRFTCRSVANIVKEYTSRAGFDAAIGVTSAAVKGASIFKIMDQSGHNSIDTLRAYVRDAELFKDRAGSRLP
jgi:hypothetical protein